MAVLRRSGLWSGLFVDPEREVDGSAERGRYNGVCGDEGDRGLQPVEKGRSVSCGLVSVEALLLRGGERGNGRLV